MRVTTEALAPATRRVLEAALLGEGWPEALSRFAEATGATGAVIVNEAAQGRTTLLPTESVAEPVADYRVGKTPPDPRAALVSPRFRDGFVTDGPAGSRGETVAALREAFGLTATEAAVAALVAMGLPPKLAARLLVIGEGTARNQLKAARSKAGVHRQVELAGLTGSLRP